MRRRAETDKSTIIGLEQVNEEVVYPHVFANTDREVGGVLVGRVPLRGGMPLVTGAIEALAADEQRATLTFTQDAWSHVHATLDRDFPESEQIVGWYHSHPGFGIFLSGHDLFIHKNFFAGISQIALVVDPHAGTEGVFVWRDGEIEVLFERPTPPKWEPVGARPGPPARDQVSNGRTARVAPPERRVNPLLPGLLAVALAVVVWFMVRPSSEPVPPRPEKPAASTHKSGRATKRVVPPAPSKPANTTSTQSTATSTQQSSPTTPVSPPSQTPTVPSSAGASGDHHAGGK
jgi:proteasome lid subunit RPN8/RPN11